ATPTFFIVHVVDTTAPTLTLPGNITTNATGPSGAVVTYSASATDIVDGSLLVSCNPASGSTFALGSTSVNCSATDSHGNSTNGSFIVNVQDPDGPIISVPANITAEATSPTGAAVGYSASATDLADGPVPVTCTPGSGSSFGFGTTAVNCSATDSDGNTNSASFFVTVQDITAPAIAPHSDFTTTTSDPAGVIVNYTSPSTSDAVDGAGIASCSPGSGSLFPVGDTQVTCTATDSHGNSATSTFFIHVKSVLSSSTLAPSTSPSALSTSSGFIIPLTGGGLIDLECNSVLWAFGIKLSFLNLCDHQTTINSIGASDLPAGLPDGFSFVMGLDVQVLSENQIITDLPDGSGIEMDFPIYAQSRDQFAVLYWSDADGNGNGEWIEVSQQLSPDAISKILSSSAGDQLYRLIDGSASLTDLYYPILTTDKTGVFILVNK
ncbi:MAG TPA: HYR domain-containing protein, partial [Anaerolineales bacterium]|nr:HYR domain-containing protein [Anaerolineales bacterium]